MSILKLVIVLMVLIISMFNLVFFPIIDLIDPRAHLVGDIISVYKQIEDLTK